MGCFLVFFDNWFWIFVLNILLWLCKGFGFGVLKCLLYGELFLLYF